MTAPKILTFGCRLNAQESEAMAGHLAGTDTGETVIVNTCAVTGEAVRQARQAIRKARRNNPKARLVVTGCAAQIDAEQFAAMPEVDRVLGNTEKLDPRALRQAVSADQGTAGKIQSSDIMAATRPGVLSAAAAEAKARAYVQVQTGCDHRCTFCVIPFGRGNARSVPVNDVAAQAGTLLAKGAKEIVLTGVDLTAYGKDLPGRPALGDLVARLLQTVPDLPRLRLSSIDAVEVDGRLMDLIASEPRLMPHLHLSLQSGSDMILKRMKRRHSRADAIAFCSEIRARRPGIAFGADIIAGFPTETEAMFADSLSLLDACGLTWVHVFPYSPRPGTPAARMPQLDRARIKERAARLRAAAAERARAYLESQAGRILDVLVEEPGRGRTESFASVALPGALPSHSLHRVRITGATDTHLIGEPPHG